MFKNIVDLSESNLSKEGIYRFLLLLEKLNMIELIQKSQKLWTTLDELYAKDKKVCNVSFLRVFLTFMDQQYKEFIQTAQENAFPAIPFLTPKWLIRTSNKICINVCASKKAIDKPIDWKEIPLIIGEFRDSEEDSKIKGIIFQIYWFFRIKSNQLSML